MAGLVEGALVGCAVVKLLTVIIDEANIVVELKTHLESIKSLVLSLRPEIERREKVLESCGRGEENRKFAELVDKGTELVKKCSKVGRWNLKAKHTYSKELSKLEESISKYCGINLAVQTNITVLETLNVVENLSKRFEECITSGRIDVNGSVLEFSVYQHNPLTHTFGLDVPLKELKMKLLDKEVKVLAICGQGGCGKTTLAIRLCEDSLIKGIYGENIHFLTVSKVPNKTVLNQLKIICNGVNSKPKLVILDDVWLDSAKMIDDFSNSGSELKLLVTSRFELPRVRNSYSLKRLDVENAEKLFKHAVSFENVSGDRPANELTKKILKICNGLPLALREIGLSLNGQHWTVWETQVAEMVKGETFLDSKEVVLNRLRTSIDDLDLIMRESFLDLGAFPEDMRIPAAALVDISVELYKEDKKGIYALRNLFQLHMRHLVDMLVTREDTSKVDGYCNEHFVTQPNLLRQLAIFETNKAPVEERTRLFSYIAGNDVPVTFITLEKKPASARLVSITTDAMFTSMWIDMQLPRADVLILNMTSKCYWLPEWGMSNLKVLIITNNDPTPTELKNLHILDTFPGLKRIRFERISFASLGHSYNGMHFQNLTKVSFIMCDIQQAMKNCSVRLSEMLPVLEEIDINYCDDLSVLPPGLCDLPFLRRLSLTNCSNLSALPEEISYLSNLETLRLHSCTKLLKLPNTIKHLQKLKLIDISDCCSLNQLPEDIGHLTLLETLIMNGCSDFLNLPNSVTSLAKLSSVYCDDGVAYLWKHLKNPPKNLKVMMLKRDNNLNWLHNSSCWE